MFRNSADSSQATITLAASSPAVHYDGVQFTTNAGTAVDYQSPRYDGYDDGNTGEKRTNWNRDDERIYSPKLYFKYVKSKLTKIQQDKLKKRLANLKKLIVQTKALGQQALYEKIAEQIAVTVRESEAFACGVQYKVHKEEVTKLMHKVKDLNIEFDGLGNFPRVIPAKVTRKINQLQKAQIFDEYKILYTTQDKKEKLKTNKQKIKEKDPILFGVFNFAPDTFYFIIDWEDEYCDLTIDKFVDIIKEDDPEYELDKIPDIDEKYINKIVAEVSERQDRLDRAEPSNYRQLMKKEDLINKINIFKKAKPLFKKTEQFFNKMKEKFKIGG